MSWLSDVTEKAVNDVTDAAKDVVQTPVNVVETVVSGTGDAAQAAIEPI